MLGRALLGWLAASLACLAAQGCAADPPTPAARSETAPLHLLDLDGRPADLWPRGQSPVTVVLFIRSDCPISNRCAPEFQRLHESHQGVEFCLIYVDPHEQPNSIRRHLSEYGYTCRALRDPDHKLVALCGASITPEAVVFAKDRSIVYRGRVNDLYIDTGNPRPEPTTHDLADAIDATVRGSPVLTPRTKAVGCLIADLKD